jgi:branched-chain amino acid transport system ATP-binding protein
MTVMDNLLMGAYLRKNKEDIKKDLEYVFEIFPRLKERRNQLAGKLSGGEQQMCAIGRGIMSSPKILLIDELSLGLAPKIVDELIEIVAVLRRRGISIVLVEQDVQIGLEISDRAYVIEHGKIVMTGLSKDLLINESIRKAYLGI